MICAVCICLLKFAKGFTLKVMFEQGCQILKTESFFLIIHGKTKAREYCWEHVMSGVDVVLLGDTTA